MIPKLNVFDSSEKKILVIIDIQEGFTQTIETKECEKRIVDLLEQELFDIVISTKYQNYPNSSLVKFQGWTDLTTPESQVIPEAILKHTDHVFSKSLYSCVNTDFIHILSSLNGGSIPKTIYMAGVDTDCCVIKSAADAYERFIRPVVLADYCASSGGEECQKAGLKCMIPLIGENQIFYGRDVRKVLNQ